MTLQMKELLVLPQRAHSTNVHKIKSPHCEGFIEELIYKRDIR